MIYFLHSDKFIKIGFSRNGFRSETTFNPYEITLLGWIEGDREKELELHHQFDHLRVKRRRGRRPEWFHCDYKLVLFIVDLLEAEHAAEEKEGQMIKFYFRHHCLPALRRLKAKALKEKQIYEAAEAALGKGAEFWEWMNSMSWAEKEFADAVEELSKFARDEIRNDRKEKAIFRRVLSATTSLRDMRALKGLGKAVQS